MRNPIYIAPVIENISVQLEQGIAASGVNAGYGDEGAAGAAYQELGDMEW